MNIEKKKEKALKRYRKIIEKSGGKVNRVVRPESIYDESDEFRADGFMNVLNKYGTEKDTTENYFYEREPQIPDDIITAFYESNGLFAKIIDLPAEEAIKHGFELDGIESDKIEDFYREALDDLDWEEKMMTAVKWTRLYGGALIVMLINDGGKLEDPVNWEEIESIDELIVYERPIVFPDYSTLYHYRLDDPKRTRGSRFGMPERYHVFSRYGSFVVHESRCLVFRNGILPERCMNRHYRYWGTPEYLRIKNAIRDSEIAHGSAVKMLDRAVQAVYSMKNLSELLETQDGENIVLKRLDTIDMARGLLNSIAIDAEGESYDFRQFSFSGVSEVVDTTCNYLSALTSIPQTVLFGKDPSGMNATGMSDLENYYNFVERIQKKMVKGNLNYLLSIIFKAGENVRAVEEVPSIKVKFSPLWSMSEMEETRLEQAKAQVRQTKASIATTYIQAQVLDPSEVRQSLADEKEFNIETMLDDYTEEELEENDPAKKAQEQQGAMGGMPGAGGDDMMAAMMGGGGGQPMAAQSAGKQINEQQAEEQAEEQEPGKFVKKSPPKEETTQEDDANTVSGGSVGVLVIKNGKFLVGKRMLDTGGGLLCGPGGHIEPNESPVSAAAREMKEEFNITPNELIYIGRGHKEPNGLEPYIFLCTSWKNKISCKSSEIRHPRFMTMKELYENVHGIFQPFKSSINLFTDALNNSTEKVISTNIFGKRVDNSDEVWYNINVRDDGAPYGNRNASKHKRGRLSKKDLNKYERRILGIKTANGIVVSSFTTHSVERIAERNISVKRVEDCLNSSAFKKSVKHGNPCFEFETKANRVILDPEGNIVTVMWRKI